MFIRNKQAVFFTMIMPVVIMTILGLLSFDSVPKIELGVAVTNPPTQGTRQFIEQLKQVPAFEINLGTEPDERAALEKGDRHAVMVIPGDMFPENQTAFGGPKDIVVLTNANAAQMSSTAVSIINQILDKTTLSVSNAPTLFNLKTEQVNSRDLKYIDFLVPGIVALSLMQMSVFSVAFVFVDFKEKGILKRLLATPMRPYQFVVANVITRLMVAVIQSALLIAIGVLIFNAHVIGSVWLLVPVVILGSIMFLGLGFTLSGLAKTVESVPAIANIAVFPMMFLGGVFFPISTMPNWLQNIAGYLPLTYLSNSIREVMIEGATFSDIQTNIYWMIAWAVVLVVAANFVFGFEEKRQ